MTLDPVSVSRLTLVHPRLRDIVYRMFDILSPMNPFRVAQGLRTYSEQDALYAQGRTASGAHVTNAIGGFSAHNFGLAVDLYPLNPDGSIDWNPAHPDWKQMESVMITCGLESGATWKRLVDAPHGQLVTPIWPITPTDAMRAAYLNGQLPAVWGMDK